MGRFATAQSLDALRALVAAEHPGIPFADGDPASGLMILGEGPSEADLESGRPFSGPAGRLLDWMLAAIGRDRTRAYVALLCPRRMAAGPATAADIARDLPLARHHVRLVQPRALLLMGGPAAQALIGDPTPIGRLRGQWRDLVIEGAPVRALATFNPAYLLRRPEDKALAWADLLALTRKLDA
jgi:DNA polymerase